MMILGERAIYDALGSALVLFRENLDYFVPDIYGQETPDNIESITEWWSNTSNTVSLVYGYVMRPVSSPRLAITTENEQIVAENRHIGYVAQPLSTINERGSVFQSTYYIHVLGENEDWLYWMQIWTKWAMLIMSQYMEDTYGLMDQIVSMDGLRPVPDSMKDAIFPFERLVMFSCKHHDTWKGLPYETIVSAAATFAYSAQGGDEL